MFISSMAMLFDTLSTPWLLEHGLFNVQLEENHVICKERDPASSGVSLGQARISASEQVNQAILC